MSYVFQSLSYPTTDSVVLACAREWITASGANDEIQVRRSFATTSDEDLADEVIDDWDLDETRDDRLGSRAYHDEDGDEVRDTQLTAWDADHGDMTRAFAQLRDEYAAVESR